MRKGLKIIMKKILLVLTALFLLLLVAGPVQAKENSVVVQFFWALGCPHCTKEELFLKSLESKYPQLEIKDYEITNNRQNLALLQKMGKELKADVSGVPFTIVGKKYFSGYLSDETTGKDIEAVIQNETDSLTLPIIGRVNLKTLSLPVLTFLIALFDGFNPCAMWTLLFLISLLLGMKDRKRMWLLGTTFIAASALVYFLFLAAWLNLFLFLGFIVWVRIAIGLIALATGGYFLKDYVVNKKAQCQVMGNRQQKVMEKIKTIVKKKQLLLSLLGIVILAFAVNLVELICSAGLPAIYTKILSLSSLPTWQYYLYLLFYILIFMLDDLFIFFTAMFTLQTVGLQSKYSRFSHLIGGILMLIIGLLLLFKPELLMFG